ncbi:hypothetical protein BX257_4056 [Streptomyces sp. 3212.3]|uniref:hypothetical protein n=1 Tax=Streptomyces sp. 3212.3 TaxID=1938846 RepID=UPI000E25C656|nr:hypothetical protein [Streptomyces sp. 3212.3]REE61477.1 hypothetical protein BX257_4056 [Streptomyces sp. 3212.3]
MAVTLERPAPAWLVVFDDAGDGMRVVDVIPAPADLDQDQMLWAELHSACVSIYRVWADTPTLARLTARQLYDVERIRSSCARMRADRGRRSAAPSACTSDTHPAIRRAARGIALTRITAQRTEGIVLDALRAGYRFRPLNQRHLSFEQFVARLNGTAAATLYQHAAFVASGRDEEAAAVLVHTLAALYGQ